MPNCPKPTDAHGRFGRPRCERSIAARDWAGADLAPGRHRVSVALRRQLVARDGPSFDLRTPVGPAVDGAATLDVDVLPRDAPIGTAVPAPDQADAIARAVAVHAYHWHGDRCFAEVRLLPAPVDRAFAVYAVIDGVEQRIGGACARANADVTTDVIYVPVDVGRARAMPSLAIVLVGDGGPLAETIDQQNYWLGRIAFDAVPLGTFDDYVATTSVSPRPTTLPFRADAAR